MRIDPVAVLIMAVAGAVTLGFVLAGWFISCVVLDGCRTLWRRWRCSSK